MRCEASINYCQNVTCENKGVCRSLFLNYTCECLTSGFSGRHCEIIGHQTRVYQILSKSFASVAIAAIVTLVVFVLVMDVLKYVFGIDVTAAESREIRRQMLLRKKKLKMKPPLIVRFIYIHTPEVSP